MPEQIGAQQFQLLRARIEAEMPAPACITVTSACERDGKSVTASGLAEHLALLSIRRGRPAVDADTEMIRVLESGRVKILGVVTASPAAIREHDRRGARRGTALSRAYEDSKAPHSLASVKV